MKFIFYLALSAYILCNANCSKNLIESPPEKRFVESDRNRRLRGKPDIGPKILSPVPDKLTQNSFENDEAYF